MARPKKQSHEKRTDVVRARVTVAEKAHVALQAQAVGLDVTEYVRRRVLGHQLPSVRAQADARLIADVNRLGIELRSIGINVNQLARAVHTGRGVRVDWAAVYDRLQQLTGEVAGALEKIAGR